jgi:transposase InsO family protein
MPWKETGRVFERTRFIEDYLSGCFTISELSSRYHVSRKTLYKWIGRHDHSGLAGLEDCSRAPIECPHRTAEAVEDAIIAFRKRFPFMGPKKIIARLSELEPDVDWPAPSTAGEILDRRGLIEHRKRRRPSVHPSRMPAKPIAPNDVMTIDYKGHFRLGNHQYCYPLTIVDGFSRYILACEALTSTRYEGTRKAMEHVFRKFGLPRSILSDNGAPFASPGLGHLSRLSMWWIRLGIGIQRIVPGNPQQNGSHERMHRTLKAQTTRPPAFDSLRQHRKFDKFVREFNHERPHEALEQRRPATLYAPSSRPYPERLPRLEYDGHMETRIVTDAGMIKWKKHLIFASHTLARQRIAFEEIDDGIWSVYYGEVLLARFDERDHIFYG